MTIKHLKPSAIYFFLLLSILVCSCTDNRYPRQLVVADSLSESNTTSAANYIDSIINHSKDMSKSERMRFLLLRAKIENRNQSLTMSSDIMKTLSEYYDDGGSGNERMLFKYIEGCCYNRSDKKQKALECFQTAAEYADTLDSNCDFKTLCRIHVQTATLFQEQISPYNAIKEWDKAHKYALAAKDTFLAVASYAYRAASFYKMGMKDSVISISENAHRLFKEHNYNNYAALQYGMIIFIYTEKGQPERAKPYFGEYEKESGLFDDNGNIKRGHEIYYYSKGLYYLYKNNTDSAEYFFRKELESASDINNRQAAYRGLYLTYKKYQIQDSITKYAELWNSMTDSAFINKSTLQLQQMAAMYDYSINKRIAEESLYEARLSKYIAMTLALVLFCSIMVFYVIYQKRKERINELNNKIALDLILINKKEIELKLLKSDNSVSNKTIKEKEEEISELQERIKTYEKK
ncbi:MAG: hypothetical protein Q4D41_07240, partial [Prevotellaceae bacterium]|nr:hypothetical protein [Prevotellaceae bacterium]